MTSVYMSSCVSSRFTNSYTTYTQARSQVLMLVKLSSLAVISPYTPLVVYPKLRELHVSYKLSTTQVQGKSVSPNSLKAMSEIRETRIFYVLQACSLLDYYCEF